MNKNSNKISKGIVLACMLFLTTILVHDYIRIYEKNSSSATYDKFITEKNGQIISEVVTVRG